MAKPAPDRWDVALLAGFATYRLVLAAIFAVNGILGLFISNTSTAVVMAIFPLAVASALDALLYPFAMTVALAVPATFMPPVSTPVNSLGVGPGNYLFPISCTFGCHSR